MTVSDIRIRKISQEGRLRAVVSMTIDGSIAIHDIRIIQGGERMFVAMPSRRDESGTYRDIVHPISPDARNHIESMVMDEYQRYLASMNEYEQ